MTNHQTEFKNQNIKVMVSHAPGSKVSFVIAVSPEATKAAYSKAIKAVNKEVSLPGFRKGKAPDALVVQGFGKHVDQEWNDLLLNTAFKEALDLTKIHPFSQESIKRPQMKQLSKDLGAEFTIEFEAYPEIPEVNPKDLVIKTVHPETVKTEDVEDSINQIRQRYADWEDLDRGIHEGDFVDLDIDAVEGEELRNLCKDTRMEVKEGHMGRWMRQLILGKKSGDEVEGMSEDEREQPQCNACDHGEEGHTHELPEFVPTKCRIKIKAVKKAILPPVDDELAKKTGVETAEELKKRVTQQLEGHARTKAETAMRKELEAIIKEKYQFEVPASLTLKEKQSRLKHELSHVNKADLTPEKKKEIEAKVSKEVEGTYRLMFINQKVATDHKLNVTSAELTQEYMKQLYMVPEDERIIDQSMEQENIQSRLYTHLLFLKAIDYLLDHATKK